MEPVEVVWEEPPEKNPSGIAESVARALRARPNVWAKVLGPTNVQKIDSLRIMLRRGGSAHIVRGEFECRRHKLDRDDDLSYCLWARYVDNGSEAAS